MNDDQIKNLSAMGGCSAAQPSFLEILQGLKEVHFEGLKWFAFRDMIENGVVLAGSNDDSGGVMDGIGPVKIFNYGCEHGRYQWNCFIL